MLQPHSGRTEGGCYAPLVACMATYNTARPHPQGEDIQFSYDAIPPSPVSEMCVVFSSANLHSHARRPPRKVAVNCTVLN